MWPSLREVGARAGDVELVRAGLAEGRVVARAAAFLPASMKTPERIIPPEWWAGADAEINTAASQAKFKFPFMAGGGPYFEVTAFGVELEPGAANALWPAETKPPPEPVRAGGKPGRKELDVWPVLWEGLKSVVAAKRKKFPSMRAAAQTGAAWLEENPKLPQLSEDVIREKLGGLREKQPELWKELIAPN